MVGEGELRVLDHKGWGLGFGLLVVMGMAEVFDEEV